MNNEDMPPAKYNAGDYVLEFEAEGLKLLFQEIMYRNYYLPGSLMLFKDNVLKSLIAKKTWEDMGRRGLGVLSDPNSTYFADVARIIRERKNKLAKLVFADQYAIDNVETIFELFSDIAKNYGYFNIAYLEAAYTADDASETLRSSIRKVENLKNSIKEDFNDACFFSQGLWAVFMNRVSAQFDIRENVLAWYRQSELLEVFEGNYVSMDSINRRRRAYIFCEHGFREGDSASRFIDSFEGNMKESSDPVIQGITANLSSESIISKVKKINVNYDNFEETRVKMEEMKQGEVLVSRTTDPSIIEACQKASAIVTDIGGMLSHAAITARELGIPCVVGTQIGSKVLHDGDLVEVDAEGGTVMVLRKKRECRV